MGGYQKRTAHIATDPKVVLFSTFDGRGYSDSPKAIYEYMCSDPRFADYTFVWAFREPKKFTYVLDHPNTYMVTVNTPAYEEACARAKYWFFNYRIADHIYPKDDQVYVQLWHGTPLKRLGYDISISDNAMNSKEEIRQKYKVDAEKFKYILAPSAFAAEKFISAWNLQAVGKADTVLEAGYPRNDFLINHTPEDEAQIKRELGLPMDKKVILYAPTWRDNQHDAKLGYVYRTHMDFDALRREFGDQIKFLKGMAVHAYRVIIPACLCSAITCKVLDTGADFSRRFHIRTLEAFHLGFHKTGTEIRILSERFHHSPPSGIPHQVCHGRKSHMETCSRCLFCRNLRTFFCKLRLKGSRLSQRSRKNGLHSMDPHPS